MRLRAAISLIHALAITSALASPEPSPVPSHSPSPLASPSPRVSPSPVPIPKVKSTFQLPNQPSAPPSLEFRAATDTFRCERSFKYRGKIYPCDSVVRQDAEGLRPIIKDVPAAIAELDQYQSNRKGIRQAAYIGSAGLAVIILGSIVSGKMTNEQNVKTSMGQVIGQISLYGGLAVTGGSVFWGLSNIRNNETHLNEAVRLYNQSKPDQPIEILISTSF